MNNAHQQHANIITLRPLGRCCILKRSITDPILLILRSTDTLEKRVTYHLFSLYSDTISNVSAGLVPCQVTHELVTCHLHRYEYLPCQCVLRAEHSCISCVYELLHRTSLSSDVLHAAFVDGSFNVFFTRFKIGKHGEFNRCSLFERVAMSA